MKSTLASDAGLTKDAFLGGQLHVWQPLKGYRAGVDPVLLAASVQAIAGQSVLELGCGVGTASLCLARRVSGLQMTGLELQPDYADLARRNAAENQIEMQVVAGDLGQMPRELRNCSFDHVFANPPYFLRSNSIAADNTGREASLGEGVSLSIWVDAAIRRLKPKGWLAMIQRTDRLPEILAACDQRVGDLKILPIAARTGRAADLVLVHARKGSRGAFRLLSPLVMHRGDRHLADGESYTDQVNGILRNAKRLKVE